MSVLFARKVGSKFVKIDVVDAVFNGAELVLTRRPEAASDWERFQCEKAASFLLRDKAAVEVDTDELRVTKFAA